MDSADGNDVSVVLGVEVVEIRSVLEVVGINLAAFNDLVGDYVVCVLLDVESDVLLGKDILCNCEDLGVRSGRSGDRDGLTFK